MEVIVANDIAKLGLKIIADPAKNPAGKACVSLSSLYLLHIKQDTNQKNNNSNEKILNENCNNLRNTHSIYSNVAA